MSAALGQSVRATHTTSAALSRIVAAVPMRRCRFSFDQYSSWEHPSGSNYTVVLQEMDSVTLNSSFTFLLLRSELCMSKRGKKPPLPGDYGVHPTDRLFTSYITN